MDSAKAALLASYFANADLVMERMSASGFEATRLARLGRKVPCLLSYCRLGFWGCGL